MDENSKNMDLFQLERISMTPKEKSIIETILIEVGLEPLYAGSNDQEPKTEPVTVR